jgi:catechol 2,3-dioxygenase-like lactoylglutathione lyase family enzyme
VENLNAAELKPFVPAKDYELSKRFYQDLGFELKSDTNGITYFQHDTTTFFLQKFYVKELAENPMIHLLVEDVDAWWRKLNEKRIAEKYSVKVTKSSSSPGACATLC